MPATWATQLRAPPSAAADASGCGAADAVSGGSAEARARGGERRVRRARPARRRSGGDRWPAGCTASQRRDERDAATCTDVGWRASAASPIVERRQLRRGARRVRRADGPQRRWQEHACMDLMAGMRRPAAGDGRAGGRPLDDVAGDRARPALGHLPQAVRAELSFTVEQLVLMGRYPHADRWFESEADREAVDARWRACGCLAFRRPPAVDAQRRRAATGVAGRVSRAAARACCCSTSRPTFLDVDQQLQCFSLLRDRGAARAGVRGGDARLQPGARRSARGSSCSPAGRSCRDMPVADALERPDWLPLFSSASATDDDADGTAVGVAIGDAAMTNGTRGDGLAVAR